MYVVGTIAEYNPFHKGHAYQLHETRKRGATHIVTVLGSCFTQRGDVALLSKAARCEAAIRAGSDLVLELPVTRTMAPAQKFARGGVQLLSALGVVDAISFGCECGDADALISAASAVDSPTLRPALDNQLRRGLTFAAARQAAVEQTFGTEVAALLRAPNNILAIEYLSAIRHCHADFDCIAIPRRGADHDSPQPAEFCSAAAIRAMCETQANTALPYLPDFSGEILQREIAAGRTARLARLETAILCKLKTMEKSDFASLPDLSEGLENRIYSAAQSAVTLDELLMQAKTRRYTLARIRRIVLSAFLGLDRALVDAPLPYIRVLGFSNAGAALLRLARSRATLPILMKPAAAKADAASRACMEAENRAAGLFNMACQTPVNAYSEYTTQIYKKGE